MIIKWVIMDGVYSMGPYTTEVPDTLLEECSDEEDREDLIAEYIQVDFENQGVSWCETSRDGEKDDD